MMSTAGGWLYSGGLDGGRRSGKALKETTSSPGKGPIAPRRAVARRRQPPRATGTMEVRLTLENRPLPPVGVGTLLWPPVGATTGGRLWPARIRILVASRSAVSVVNRGRGADRPPSRW